jgi:transcription initiation factor TFIID subunit 4
MEDDDIMDVTSMAGVNLMEETAQMAASVSTLSGMTRSVKDDSFLSPDCLQQRVNEIGLKYGVEQISPEVYTLLSHAVEERLKNLIERLITVSQHRLEIHQEESRCEVACDVKSQLKIFERIDKFHVNQRKEREREMLLKAAKSRSKQDDAELAVLKEKAKQMQQEELEQMQKRAANQTALQAIGQRKKPKIDFSNLDGSDTSSLSNPAGSVSVRAQARKTRPRRINLRDLIFILEQDKETRRSIRLYETLLK